MWLLGLLESIIIVCLYILCLHVVITVCYFIGILDDNTNLLLNYVNQLTTMLWLWIELCIYVIAGD